MMVVLVLLWLAGMIASIRFLIRPSTRWPMYRTRGRALGMGLLIFVGIPLLATALGLSKPQHPPSSAALSTESARSPLASGDVASPTPAASSAASSWSYDEGHDAMRGTITRYARTDSNEEFENSFGSDEKRTTLEIQKHGSRFDVAIVNPNLQFTCNSFGGTHVSVKFDGGSIERYGCTDAVGDKYGVAFISAGDRFVAKLRHARKVTIEAEVFQRGGTQMSFDVADLAV